MTELLTAAQMRAIEQAAIESGEVTGLELMERAGRGVVEAIFEEWPDLAKSAHRAVVLCGPGNNGGDGFVVARLLKEWGWEVEVLFYGTAEHLPDDARTNYERWLTIGSVVPLVADSLRDAVGRAGHPGDLMHAMRLQRKGLLPGGPARTLFIDALFGTGISRGLPDELQEILDYEWTEPCMDFGVSVDLPSGICADSGRPFEEGWHPASRLVVTFHRQKLAHHLGPWVNNDATLKTVDIGLPSPISETAVSLVEVNDVTALDVHRKLPARHKFGHGHALILSGGAGHTGAARLAARGALRIGAGLVTLGVPGSAQQEAAAQLTAIMLARVGTAEDLAAALEDERINALCLGPGLGIERARELVPVALGGVESCPMVLDADALTAYADDPGALFAMLHPACVLTPHGGEFRRLFPDIAERLEAPATKVPAYSKVDATREAAARAGCVVLFKGPDTVIADPQGHCAINSSHYERSAPWLATAGSGDVLAGFITGLLARGFAPMQAAETGAWLHTECALSFGPGLIAEDLPEELPKVFRKLGL